MKSDRQPYKTVSDISVLQMTLKLSLLAVLFLITSIGILVGLKSIISVFR